MSSEVLATCKPPLHVDGLPDGWRDACLGDLCRINIGGTPPRHKPEYWATSGDGHPWVAISDLRQPVIAATKERITDAGVANSNVKLVKAGTIMMSFKLTIGRVAVAGTDLFTNEAIASFVPVEGIDTSFLPYWLSRIVEDADTDQAIKGVTLNKQKLATLSGLLPPLDEQRRIAEVLRSVDEAIVANEAVAVQARRTYQAALTELVGSGLDHWETVCLGQIATFVNGRGFKPHEWGDEGFPIIRIQNLNGGTDFNYYSGDFNPKILVRPGDLLFAWSGSRGTSFGPHIWRGPEGVLNYHTWKVVPAAPEDRDYLYFALRHLTKKIEDEAHGASALVHMQKAYVVDYEIQLPPTEERSAIAATLIDLQEAANHADRVYGEARAMKVHLMSDLLSGRVRVPA